LEIDDARGRFLRMGSAELGRFGEALWSAVFSASGVRYVPLCRIENGGAPMLEGNGRIVLPDFDAYGKGWTAFIDSKAKTNVVRFNLAKELRHGIDRRNWEEYLRCGVVARKKTGIAIVEVFGETKSEWSGALLIESLRNLNPPIAGFSNQEHMVYWPRKRFVELDTLNPLELFEVAKNVRPAPSYREELRQIFNFDAEFQGDLFQ